MGALRDINRHFFSFNFYALLNTEGTHVRSTFKKKPVKPFHTEGQQSKLEVAREYTLNKSLSEFNERYLKGRQLSGTQIIDVHILPLHHAVSRHTKKKNC